MTDDRPSLPNPAEPDNSDPTAAVPAPVDPAPEPGATEFTVPEPGASEPTFPEPGASEPPPMTAFAWRHGLVRPVEGRVFAGVCGAFARATNTDPVLWRVILAVLTIFGGIGGLIYLLAWLLLPADGDTAAPLEALAGRGWSRTSTVRTIVGTVIALIALIGYASEPFRATPLIVMLLLGGALLLLLRDRTRARGGWSAPATPPGGPSGAAPPGYGAAPPGYGPASATVPSAAGPAATFFAGTTAPPYGGPTAPMPAVPPTGPGYPPVPPPPFAPHGPFVPPPVPPTYTYRPPRPPKPRQPRSKLGGLTFSLVLLTIGGLAVANLTGLHVAPLAFVAAGLTVVGLGLVVGAWIGRSYWLIPLGIVLSLVLGLGTAVNGSEWPWLRIGTTTWAPPAVNAIRDSYRQNIGDATLDLSNVDFSKASQTVEITVRVDLGSLKIIVPANVDTTVDATVDLGNAEVFKERWDGAGSGTHTISDAGADGAGGARLHIKAFVTTGNLEVHR